jgi:hypothetical protein
MVRIILALLVTLATGYLPVAVKSASSTEVNAAN